jgi:hypothetical protein
MLGSGQEHAQGIKISCKGPIHITNGRIVSPNKYYASHITFLDCNTVAPTPIEGLASAENNSLELGTNKTSLENGRTLLALASGHGFQNFEADSVSTPTLLKETAGNYPPTRKLRLP